MNTARLLRHSLKTMGRYKLRSGFMMLGTLLGVAALTLVLSIGEAAERKVLTTVNQIFGSSAIMVYSGGGMFKGGPRVAGTRLTLDDGEALAREIPGIDTWDPGQFIGASVKHEDASMSTRVLGQSERSERVWNRSVSRGEYFDAAAVAGAARVALIGETVVKELFKGEDPIGGEIEVNSVRLRVIGILEALGTDAHGMDRDAEIVVPISTAMRRILNVDTIRAIKLLVKDPALVESTAPEVEVLLRERHGIAAGQPDDFTVLTPSFVQGRVAQMQRVSFVFLPLIAGISLLAGAVVAASLMLSSVASRSGEIGLRRALGARPQDISRQFLLESSVTTLTGGLFGLAIGFLGARVIAMHIDLSGTLSLTAALVGIGASIATGFLAGVLPARRAARLQPADALR